MDTNRIFCVLLLVLATSALGVTYAKTGFLFTMPRVIRSGTMSEFCLVLHGNSEEPTPISMTLISAEDGKTATKIEEEYIVGEQKCIEFQVPKPGEYEMVLENSTDLLHDSVKVTVLGDKLITLVQTDKPMYKPGQTVKFRIMTLLSTLKPRIGKIRSIYILDPNNIRVKQYLNVENKGLSSLEFQLAPQAKLGDWLIEVMVDETEEKYQETVTAVFEVKEYVLPRFDVEITPPSYILANSEIAEGKVCAKYTYGKPVTGYLDLKVCWSSPYMRLDSSCFHQVIELSGCHPFSVNLTEMKNSRPDVFGAELKIDASVTEEGTGSTVNKSHTGPGQSFEALTLEMDDYNNGFFKPGLPFYGKVVVKKPDGTPAPGELIKITAFDNKNNIRFSGNFTSDAQGIIDYALCGSFTENSTSISIDAEAILYDESDGLYTPRGHKGLRQWFSPSFSYIEIPRVYHEPVCGASFTLSIPFTTRPNTHVDFHYQVMARGKVIETGKIPYDPATIWPGMALVEPHLELCLQEEELPATTPTPAPTTPEILQEIDDVVEEDPEDYEDEEEEETNSEVVEPPSLSDVIHNIHGDSENFEEPIMRSELVSDTVATFLLHLNIKPVMAPKFTLLVYHVMPDGEVVADSVQFKVNRCFDNEVKMNFNQTTALPGEEVELKLKAAPGSVCGVGVVDKSVNILGGKHQITAEQVFEKVEEFNQGQFGDMSIGFHHDDTYCEQRIKDLRGETPETGHMMHWQYSSQYVDAMQAFKSSGYLVLTNLNLETRPCGRSFPIFYDVPHYFLRSYNQGFVPAPAASSFVPNRQGPRLQQATVRSHFPETWLWDLHTVGETGELLLPETAPHTITNWVGNALCLDQTKGFGLSDLTSLTTFQPFFLSLHLPYAAVRGERLPIMFTVYNYLEKCLHIQLTLDLGNNFEVHNRRMFRDPVCVCGGDSYTAKFYVTPTALGSLPVMAEAQIVPGLLCGNSVDVDTDYLGLKDVVKRQMLVKAEGVEQHYTYTMYTCTKDGQTKTEDVILPLPTDGDIVKDSARGEIKVIGDLMGPALSNLDNLVRMPTGCGEQNMIGFTPNIFVLKYLMSVGRLTEEIQKNAMKFMEIGYQRELNYRHPDGSYSAFGTQDAQGSVWLTAFVVKSFAQARPYIYIDEADMQLSVRFLRHSQLETGCFRETGKVSAYMMGGLSQSDSKESFAGLTSYVLIALLNANVNTSDSLIASAIQCINKEFQREKQNMDPYSLALVAYANALYQPNSRTTVEIMRVLDSKAKKDGSLRYWSRETAKPKAVNTWYYYAAPSAEVEMTAYALMASLIAYGNGAVGRSHDIAMWLSQQRNPYGGFASTQDTVVGLNALSEFASLTYTKGDTNLNVTVSGSQADHVFSVSEKSQTTLLLQSAPITILPNRLAISVSGVGCALIQTSVYYNKLPSDLFNGKTPDFHLKVASKWYQHDIDRCDRRTIQISVGNKGNQKFGNGMSLITVKMVTSWTPVPDSLKKLKSLFPKLGMKRLEYKEEEGLLTFYFDEFTRKPKTFTVDVEQDKELAVSSPKPAEVKVFQYYETDVSFITSYELKTICGTKAEISRKNPEIFDPDEPIPVQRRIDLVGPPPPAPVQSGDSSSVCPTCVTDKSLPDNLKELVCNSAAVYKAVSGRSGAKPMKLRQDLRPLQKVKNLNVFTDYEMANGCKCSLVNAPVKRVLVIVGEKVEEQLLTLDSASALLLTHKKLEKAVRKIQKSCPLQEVTEDDQS